MNTLTHVPPGFRFHPTDEELVDYYLRRKIASKRIDLNIIKDVDLYNIEPWDLQELCNNGNEEQNDWYFFSHKDKKYPTGTRTNRATKAGFWKATGRDKAIYSNHTMIGMRKTLVFYQGRAPNGQKSDWIMHEYRLETNENGAPQEEGWVVCRVFKKKMTTVRRMNEYESPCWYDDQVSFMQELDSPRQIPQPYTSYNHRYPCKPELELQYNNNIPHYPFLQLPQLESPKVQSSTITISCNPYGAFDKSNATQEEQMQHINHQNVHTFYSNVPDQAIDQATDWRVLDKFVASQLSHEEGAKETNYSKNNVFEEQMNLMVDESRRQENVQEFPPSMSASSSCQVDLILRPFSKKNVALKILCCFQISKRQQHL